MLITLFVIGQRFTQTSIELIYTVEIIFNFFKFTFKYFDCIQNGISSKSQVDILRKFNNLFQNGQNPEFAAQPIPIPLHEQGQIDPLMRYLIVRCYDC